jgi:hypothetical protein
VRVMSRGYVITTDVIPAIAPAVNRNGVVNSVLPGGIKNYSQSLHILPAFRGRIGGGNTRLYVV